MHHQAESRSDWKILVRLKNWHKNGQNITQCMPGLTETWFKTRTHKLQTGSVEHNTIKTVWCWNRKLSAANSPGHNLVLKDLYYLWYLKKGHPEKQSLNEILALHSDLNSVMIFFYFYFSLLVCVFPSSSSASSPLFLSHPNIGAERKRFLEKIGQR